MVSNSVIMSCHIHVSLPHFTPEDMDDADMALLGVPCPLFSPLNLRKRKPDYQWHEEFFGCVHELLGGRLVGVCDAMWHDIIWYDMIQYDVFWLMPGRGFLSWNELSVRNTWKPFSKDWCWRGAGESEKTSALQSTDICHRRSSLGKYVWALFSLWHRQAVAYTVK